MAADSLKRPISAFRLPGFSRRFIIPEIVQSSAMDCGPACLKCLLDGFGISVSYGRLREACQTDLDGTSIDTIEEVAVQLGLKAEQVMLPVDHLLLPEAKAFPAIITTRHPSGVTHFVVIWRRHGHFVQVMDPGTGRRWLSRQQLIRELYIHTMPVPAAAWLAWTGSEEFITTLFRRLANLGIPKSRAVQRIKEVFQDMKLGWHPMATLDAAVRMIDSIVRSGGLHRGREAFRVIEAFYEKGRKATPEAPPAIPPAYWSVSPAPPSPDGVEQLFLRGAVLVRALGRRPVAFPVPDHISEDESKPAPLSPELTAALNEPPPHPGREFFNLLRRDGLLSPLFLVVALALAAGGVVIEALLFRGLFDLSQELGLAGQRFEIMGAILVFAAAILLLDLPIAAGILRLGRHLEARLRVAFLEKLPRLHDRYFQSRLTSDMAERCHSVHSLRALPGLGGQFIRASFELVLTTAAIAWIYPSSAPIAAITSIISVGLPLMANSYLSERNLRVRNHTGALSRFYLDALLGLVPIRAHGAERSVRREHENLLVDWAQANLGLQFAAIIIEGIQSLIGYSLVAWLLFHYLTHGGHISGLLLLVYWGLNLPTLGQVIALLARQYPNQRNVALRLMEPLGAPEDKVSGELHGSAEPISSPTATGPAQGIAILMDGVSVRAAGHTILEEINLSIEAGSHVAIVGQSGAGKSSLVGILLGWHRPAGGRILVDGHSLKAERLKQLRQETAWVDPSVQLWNRTFLENLAYGTPPGSSLPVSRVIRSANLHQVLGKLPRGFQTSLGEGGALVSGGEGQRVRLGRAMLRPEVRLAILDEPFRGLDYRQRWDLLRHSRRLWQGATLICITHDVSATKDFDRIIVLDKGRIVENGPPAQLLSQPDSHYLAMIEAEEEVRKGLWSDVSWRKLRLEDGRLAEDSVMERMK